ncbi:MAG: hypothetical protein HN348_35170, partial [Proteobacteria bacterium]|nr:hypothetical protein [Pseudomonadota bacterium]
VDFWGYKLTLLTGDCDDGNYNSNPGITTDTWYDGVDSNCDLANDYDQDGDGYVPSTEVTAKEFKSYLANYPGLISFEFKDGDCLDADHSVLTPPLDPASVNPGIATDDWYDGVDANCDLANDFDQDVDGWVDETYSSEFDDYLDNWGYTKNGVGFKGYLDCADTDATIHPQAQEAIGDVIDQDCDGNNDGTPFYFLDGGTYDTPTDVVVTANSDHYLINFMAEARIENSFSTPGAGTTVFMDLVAPDFVDPGLGVWATTSTERGGGFDVVPTTDGALAVYSIWYHTSSTNRVTITQPAVSSDYASAQKLTKTLGSQSNNMTDIDVMLDGAGNVWILACGDDNGSSFVQVDPTDLTSSLVSKTFTMTGDICFLDDLNGANTKARG